MKLEFFDSNIIEQLTKAGYAPMSLGVLNLENGFSQSVSALEKLEPQVYQRDHRIEMQVSASFYKILIF